MIKKQQQQQHKVKPEPDLAQEAAGPVWSETPTAVSPVQSHTEARTESQTPPEVLN